MTSLPWYLSRAAGVTGYACLSGAVLLGLASASRLLPPRPWSAAWHRALAGLGLFFSGFHALLLLFDRWEPFNWVQILVPLTAPARPAAVGLGTVAFYLLAAVHGSFWLRRRIGGRAWRSLHDAAYPAYGLATLHGIFAGTDTGLPWMRSLYVFSASLTLFLGFYRWLADDVLTDDIGGRAESAGSKGVT
ncbi:MAG: ferric reductase-like transmembrane domain-containing protein [Clostridia bacterium]|nr:ferric reductase-like transmembrane domain-containing protein [Clostridia bacterium]